MCKMLNYNKFQLIVDLISCATNEDLLTDGVIDPGFPRALRTQERSIQFQSYSDQNMCITLRYDFDALNFTV